jgi:hypothetical protein
LRVAAFSACQHGNRGHGVGILTVPARPTHAASTLLISAAGGHLVVAWLTLPRAPDVERLLPVLS